MPATRNSKPAPRSSGAGEAGEIWPVLLVFVLLAVWSAAAVAYFYRQGFLLYYGDAEAHLNIARRIVDSRTPGYDQIGTVWLPLLHVLLIPFARVNHLWQSGLAAAFPSAAAFVLAGTFLFAAVRRIFASTAAAGAAAAIFALNPNLLYLQSTAMSEPLFLATLMGLLYFTVRFGRNPWWGSLGGAALACLAGTLARYEGWFLIPFGTLYVLCTGQHQRWRKALVFGAIASLGPLYWLAHNWWCCGSWLAFFSGPYSAKAIQGHARYPGEGDWGKAWLYFRTAARLTAGAPLAALGLAGAAVALVRKAFWPLLLLLLPPLFYVWSIHSAGTPIFVPDLWPHSYYNTRYGLALLPAAAFAAAALALVAPQRARAATGAVLALAASAPWLIHPGPENWITWKESQVNSEARRAWTRQAAEFLRGRYRPGSGIITTAGDLTGIFRTMGLPLKEVLSNDNWPLWPAAVARPGLFLWEEWAVVTGGDRVQTALNWGFRDGPHYRLEKTIIVKGAPVLEIYRRTAPLAGAPPGPSAPENAHENSFYEGARRPERLSAHVGRGRARR
ncbi:MAG TPA: glycosyltransferase family 39 protein [Bryobacteraceae bacterium]|nr:glycosyltransferase family 39 protein [Bryobacteraceae bacterium]